MGISQMIMNLLAGFNMRQKSAQAYYYRGEVNKATGKLDAAVEDYNKVLNLTDDETLLSKAKDELGALKNPEVVTLKDVSDKVKGADPESI